MILVGSKAVPMITADYHSLGAIPLYFYTDNYKSQPKRPLSSLVGSRKTESFEELSTPGIGAPPQVRLPCIYVRLTADQLL